MTRVAGAQAQGLVTLLPRLSRTFQLSLLWFKVHMCILHLICSQVKVDISLRLKPDDFLEINAFGRLPGSPARNRSKEDLI